MAKSRRSTTTPRHPMQPIVLDEQQVLRFKPNAIVQFLIDWCAGENGHVGHPKLSTPDGRAPDLNTLDRMDFSDEDRRQLAQLIGYSVSGYGELSYVDDVDYAVAARDPGEDERDARIAYLESQLSRLRTMLRKPMAELYEIHPDDLKG